MSLVKVTEIVLNTRKEPERRTTWINPDSILELFEKNLETLSRNGWNTTGLSKLYEVDRKHANYFFIDHDSFLNLTK